MPAPVSLPYKGPPAWLLRAPDRRPELCASLGLPSEAVGMTHSTASGVARVAAGCDDE